MSWDLYWVTACFIFVCQLDASWGCWASRCCYYCCLFCTLEQQLLHLLSLQVGWVVRRLYPSLKPGLLCGNNLDRAQGILNDRRHGDIYVACLGGSIAMCVSLPEDVGGLGCRSRTLLVGVIGPGVPLSIGVGAALISYFLSKRYFLSVILPDPSTVECNNIQQWQ